MIDDQSATGIQRAIAFLSTLDPEEVKGADLPPQPDYASLARIAASRGVPLTTEAVAAGFRFIMRARLLAGKCSTDRE